MRTTSRQRDRWAAAPPYWLNSGTFANLVGGRSFVVIDGGASSFVFDPFCYATQCVEIVAFDPDPDASRYVTDIPVRFVPYGLWKSRESCRLHVPNPHAMSSIYPPNEAFLQRFGTEVWPRRRALDTADIQTISIDDAVRDGLCSPPNFIKLDIHSAEFEALTGAHESLKNCVGVLVETWHNEVHAGQHLHGEIEALMNAEGFQLFDTVQIARWRHAVDGVSFAVDRRMLIASESLFFRRDVPPDLTLFAIACADMFRCSAYGIQLARRAEQLGTLAHADRARVEDDLTSIVHERLRAGRLRRFIGSGLKRLKKSRRQLLSR